MYHTQTPIPYPTYPSNHLSSPPLVPGTIIGLPWSVSFHFQSTIFVFFFTFDTTPTHQHRFPTHSFSIWSFHFSPTPAVLVAQLQRRNSLDYILFYCSFLPLPPVIKTIFARHWLFPPLFPPVNLSRHSVTSFFSQLQ